ncbi:hypothetical protein [Streptomyces sp. XH2]|uniref:hypothetical protein n=1 Tax=Streptomyces sp. XH2 TaxID=3412483 RepID=UPI003C798262
MPTSASIILFVFGGLMVLISLLGSGFSVREISFPRISPLIRSTAALLGAGLVVTSIVLLANKDSGKTVADPPPGTAPQKTVTSSSLPAPPSSQPPAQPSAAPPQPESPAPVPGTPRSSGPTAALLAHVPPAIRPSCSDGDASRFPASVVAVVACTPAAGFPVIYAQFVDDISTQGGFQRLVNDVTFTQSSCGPSTPLNGRQKYNNGGKEVGELACNQDPGDGDVYLTWSSEDVKIIAQAHAPLASYGQLLAWWKNAGPLHGTAT